MVIDFPYEEVEALTVPDENLMGVYRAQKVEKRGTDEEIIKNAFLNPIDTPRIKDMVSEDHKVLLLSDDIARPTPIYKLMPALLEELFSAGVRKKDIEILIALGTHRPMTGEEMVAKLGKEVVESFRVSNHVWNDRNQLTFAGKTSLGIEVWINKKVSQCDFVIGLGSIMPIEVCGFTGGGEDSYPWCLRREDQWGYTLGEGGYSSK